MIIQILAAIAFLALLYVGYRLFLYEKQEATGVEDQLGGVQPTRHINDIEEGVQIPEEDQEYLIPLTTEVLKKLAFSKRMAPSNAMLIHHLAEALSVASQSFEPRKNNSEAPQSGNTDWLWVAAFAIRLYDEGTPHGAQNTRESFVATGTLASREMVQWANKVNNEIVEKVKRGVIGEKDPVSDVTDHVETIAGTPYTADEIQDMKDAADRDAGRPTFVERVNKHRKL